MKPQDGLENTLLYKGTNNEPVTLNCIQSCAQNEKCSSFLLHYNSSECYSYSASEIPIQTYDYDSRPDTNVVWFKKICNVNLPCQRAWIFETIAGADFIGYNNKNLGYLTRLECMRKCVEERDFLCRSVKYFVSDTRNFESSGKCILSAADRHLIPNSFRVSRYENIYIENQCVNSSKNFNIILD